MDKILQEIHEIPVRARDFWQQSTPYSLPLGVPYFGMGSSYFATLAFRYWGINIQPEIASEYFYYLSQNKPVDKAVILSQSGESSETLWCADLCKQYVAITNNLASSLATRPQATQAISIQAGPEHFSSSKTYINTLLALFRGFGLDASPVVKTLENRFEQYIQQGRTMAEEVYTVLKKGPVSGLYVLGNGPNMATALEAGLILSETTRRNFHGLTIAQYDHGPKETAPGSVVIMILAKGPTYERSHTLAKQIQNAGAKVLFVEEPDTPELFSVLTNIIPFNFMAYYLAERLGITDMFSVGGKVTLVE
ncbi:SIS domain-containing protein [Rhodocytophaga rosea]|uniref:Glutamine--fructose-6-phosphate aminotransferase [isomerizing] n=2 Tax=Rhodocytophaga rosea TaxID=2704465 RepID=A0A6C0GV66_9BACT|nr:SIS domain-containing protein [Rhodocytophaga rosea]